VYNFTQLEQNLFSATASCLIGPRSQHFILDRNNNTDPLARQGVQAFSSPSKRKLLAAPPRNVVDIVLHRFPYVGDNVSWEQVDDFRKDPDARAG
jgi:hypothetical protein